MAFLTEQNTELEPYALIKKKLEDLNVRLYSLRRMGLQREQISQRLTHELSELKAILKLSQYSPYHNVFIDCDKKEWLGSVPFVTTGKNANIADLYEIIKSQEKIKLCCYIPQDPVFIEANTMYPELFVELEKRLKAGNQSISKGKYISRESPDTLSS